MWTKLVKYSLLLCILLVFFFRLPAGNVHSVHTRIIRTYYIPIRDHEYIYTYYMHTLFRQYVIRKLTKQDNVPSTLTSFTQPLLLLPRV